MFDSSDVQSVFSGNIAEEWEKKSRYINSLNGTLNEITLAYLNNIPIWVLEDSSEMICRLKNFLYEGKYIDKRKNVEIEFFNSAQSMIEKLNSKNILQN